MSLWKTLKGPGAQVVFSFILPVGHWDPGRVKQVDRVKDWL